ncbi:unnamed protein product [Cuscuta campestris]|uniref:Uncharacterized protein n=1 Tax=Cuscuta campestris TaxID=132261 RepID=A0A484KDI5_9ASTE|nr:unnamed protein product [Cuscuta campestris]
MIPLLAHYYYNSLFCTNNNNNNNNALLLRVIGVILLVAAAVEYFPQQVISSPAGGSKVVDYLPGFDGPLPFHLETGYIGVGESEEIQLFYYFVKSETNPKDDPVILWLSGEQGCSSLTGLVYEIGPLFFEAKMYNGTLPTLWLNEQPLTKNASIIFLDQPANVGFSYSTTGAIYTDVQASNYVYQFLQKWFSVNENFISNPFYIASGSHGALIVPTIIQIISYGNEAAEKPINLKGYILGNPKTFPGEKNFIVPFAYGMGLLSHDLYQSLAESCKRRYIHVDPKNKLCSENLKEFQKLIDGLPEHHIIEPYCGLEEPEVKSSATSRRAALSELQMIKSFEEKYVNPYGDDDHERVWCRVDYHRLSNYWANHPSVQKALHVRKGFLGRKWARCNWKTVSKTYKVTIHDTIQQHATLSAKGYRSLIYSGDHDMVVPFQSTEAWIKSLNYSIHFDWVPYMVKEQVGGYTRNFTNQMTFATVKAAGHIAGEYKPEECAALIARWISGKDISTFPQDIV